ncbi:arginyl-tRNA--protein transferase 2-like [Andrographis paniculata]|uniref:arginyl-tRNA--protein transferase 2-like n=1 Tax=Andrographis paniculata TaxID=175694 RepID=UPI0021E917EC|nr:arginyl-tRNA--protein transferase 2-like [Andrographis paniculata]
MASRSRASTSGSAGGGGNDVRGESMVIDVGRRKSTCGYCKSGAYTSISHGLWAESLTVDDYQALLDRGWRRSGCFLYKPDMKKTCCPSYTIRLKASDFVSSKEQIRVQKKMQRFLDGKLDAQKLDKSNAELNTYGGSCSNASDKGDSSAKMESCLVGRDGNDKSEQTMQLLSEKVDNAAKSYIQCMDIKSEVHLPIATVRKVASAKRKLHAEMSEELIFSCNIAFQIAAALKRLKKDIGNGRSSENEDSTDLSPKMIAESLSSHLKELGTCGLTARACNGHINFYSTAKKAEFVEAEKITKLKPSPTPVEESSGGSVQRRRKRLEILMKRSTFDSEEYFLYRKYQLQVHNDKPEQVTESSYKRFLVDTPLVYVEPTGDSDVDIPPCGFGSFHQQYVLDGKLIAVGVIDILPKCLSSKYLFWDPDLAFLSLGKYSALEEIQWVRESQLRCPTLQYYYLGYYIHSCSKMRYKASYQPSELLCPLRFEWVPYDIAKPLLDGQKYVVLSDWRSLQTGESLQSSYDVASDKEKHQSSFPDEASNDVLVNDDEMTEIDSDCSDSESDCEASGAPEDVDTSNVLLGIRGNRLRYQDVKHAFDPRKRESFEVQLQRYANVVGLDLSNRMVYSLG